MKTLLIKAYNDALKNYCEKETRGYKFGIFSRYRHSFSKTPKLAALERQLLSTKNDEDALMIIIEHLLAPKATFNNHSFNSYFIDELQKLELKQVDWTCFTPRGIKMHKGVLYRGTSQPPTKIFAEGFKELATSNFIEDYLKFRNRQIGISTSKDFDCAKDYALNTKRSNPLRYVYVIHYQKNFGFDILETGKSRGLSFNRWFHNNRFSGWIKQEVNIKNNIDKEDIVGAWELLKNGLLHWIENPNYKLQNEIKTTIKLA